MFLPDPRLILIKVSPPRLGQTVTMQRSVHILSCLILALALVLTGPGSVGPAKGAIMVTLCAGDTPVTIWLDADGNPVAPGASHAKCPDCLLFSAPLPKTFAQLPLFAPSRVPAGLTLLVGTAPWQIAHLRPDPRGPPRAPTGVSREPDPRLSPRSRLQSTLPMLDKDQASMSIRATV
jgi:hypothetical protein